MFSDNFMDMLSVLSIIMQLIVMEEQKYQSDNDDIMSELQKQNKAYLNKILDNQKIIIDKLSLLTDKVD